MRVLIVDDSVFIRKVLTQILAAEPGIEVVGTAKNGEEGVALAKALKPDIITLDIEMPVMDGMTALKKIRMECAEPRPAILMCSTLTSAGSHEALRAMRLGASDVICKDANIQAGDPSSLRNDVIAKVRAIYEQRQNQMQMQLRSTADRLRTGASAPGEPSSPAPKPDAAGRSVPNKAPRLGNKPIELVVIGSSTGGPPVLEKMLMKLPADLRVPVVIAQHMPAMFTKSIAERLDHTCAVSVVHGDQDLPLHPGTVYITQGGRHGTVVRRGGKLHFSAVEEPVGALYKPSVNVLFSSVARCAPSGCLAIVLTGMGDDGAKGAADLKAAGAAIVAQDAASCVVYGMPRAVAEAGLCDAQMTPDEITSLLGTLTPANAKAA